MDEERRQGYGVHVTLFLIQKVFEPVWDGLQEVGWNGGSENT
jgi:hypothetical protein